MRQILRNLGLRIALVAAGSGLLSGVVVSLFLISENRKRFAADLEPIEVRWVLVGVVLSAVLALIFSVLTAWVLTARTASVLTTAMYQLTHRADDFGSGGFSLETGGAATASGGHSELWQTGVEEIDTVGRILERNQRSLNRALSAERSFAADASHQLRTPLAALLMRLEEIVHTDDLAEAKVEADVAIGQTERLAGVVDDLLHRTRAGHADGGRSVSLDTVLSGLEQEWSPAFETMGRSIVVTAERAMIVRSSASAISQILNTLVENALQHGAGRVLVSATRSGPSAQIEVRDEGPGIELELARRVFDRTVTSGPGTGLGLGVARETAESFGGRLELAGNSPAVFVLYVSMASAP